MENAEMFNAATAPLRFHDFLDRMRHPQAVDIVRSIKTFIMDFTSRVPDPDHDSESVQTFLSTTEGAFQTHPLFANATDEELESAGEGLEKYLMTKLFARAFAPVHQEVEHDQRLSEKMGLLQQFIRPEHLDIPPRFQNKSSWLLAQKELQKINTYKAPRDKLVCILNCSRVINNLLLNVSLATNDNPPGADDFLPILIYIVIKANPPQLYSNLLYINRYRHRSRLISEASYFYTNLVSAEAFISTLESNSVSMDEGEYEKQLQAAREARDGMNTTSSLSLGTAPLHNAHGPAAMKEEVRTALPSKEASIKFEPGVLSIQRDDQIESPVLPAASTAALAPSTKPSHSPKESKHRNASATMRKLEAAAIPAVVEADESGQLAMDYPFLYATAGDLRVVDVESLLSSYKELVLKYVALYKAVEGTGISERNSRISSPLNSRDTGKAHVRTTAELERTTKSLSHGEYMVVSEEQSVVKEEEAPEVKRTIHSDGFQDLFDGMHVRVEGSNEGNASSPKSPTITDMEREEYPPENHGGWAMEPQAERDYVDESGVGEEHVVAEDTGHSSHEILEIQDTSRAKQDIVENASRVDS